MNKWCPRCQQYLPRDEFYRNASQSDGLAPYCKPCWREFCRVRHARLREGTQDKLGITAAKSRTIAWPESLPSSFAREFILGYFDGDGFITYHERPNRRYPYIGITSGSFNLLVSIAEVIEQHTGIRPGGPWGKAGAGAYYIRTSGNSAFIIDEWLHANGLGLKRKRLS